jgi:hypothetical protein
MAGTAAVGLYSAGGAFACRHAQAFVNVAPERLVWGSAPERAEPVRTTPFRSTCSPGGRLTRRRESAFSTARWLSTISQDRRNGQIELGLVVYVVWTNLIQIRMQAFPGHYHPHFRQPPSYLGRPTYRCISSGIFQAAR